MQVFGVRDLIVSKLGEEATREVPRGLVGVRKPYKRRGDAPEERLPVRDRKEAARLRSMTAEDPELHVRM